MLMIRDVSTGVGLGHNKKKTNKSLGACCVVTHIAQSKTRVHPIYGVLSHVQAYTGYRVLVPI